MTGKRKYLIGIYVMAMMTMGVMIVSPTLALMQRDFPDASSLAIQYMTALPTLFAIPSALSLGWLAKKIGARTTGMIALGLHAVTALGVIFSNSITAILVWRAINGIAIGLASANLIFQAQLFTPAERRAVSGYTSFFCNAISLVYAVASGMLSSMISWRASYWIYVVLCVPGIFIVKALLPSKAEMEERMPTSMKSAVQGAQGAKSKTSFNWGFWWSLFLIILCFICIGIMSSNVALHLAARGIGSSATVGIAMMVNTGTAALIGFFYEKISSKTPRWNFTIGPVIMGIGLFLAANVTSVAMLMAIQVVNGAGWGYVLAESRLLIFGTTEPSNRGSGLSLMAATMNFGQFISPLVATPRAALLFGSAPRDRFLLASCIMILVGVLYALVDPKKAVRFEEE